MNMGMISHRTEKGRTVKESGFKIGDILVGKTYMYRTQTYWYRVVGMTEKQLKLKELNVSYPTKYMSNTPGDECMPVMEYWRQGDDKPGMKKRYMLFEGFPYWPGPRDKGVFKASIQRTRTIETFPGSEKEVKNDWEYEAVLIGDRYGPHTLELWNGEPGWVNCD